MRPLSLDEEGYLDDEESVHGVKPVLRKYDPGNLKFILKFLRFLSIFLTFNNFFLL